MTTSDCLETTGPRLGTWCHVAHQPGNYLPTLYFEEFVQQGSTPHRADCPERSTRSPTVRAGSTRDHDDIDRALRLLDTLETVDPRAIRAIAEIRSRILSVHPGHV